MIWKIFYNKNSITRENMLIKRNSHKHFKTIWIYTGWGENLLENVPFLPRNRNFSNRKNHHFYPWGDFRFLQILFAFLFTLLYFTIISAKFDSTKVEKKTIEEAAASRWKACRCARQLKVRNHWISLSNRQKKRRNHLSLWIFSMRTVYDNINAIKERRTVSQKSRTGRPATASLEEKIRKDSQGPFETIRGLQGQIFREIWESQKFKAGLKWWICKSIINDELKTMVENFKTLLQSCIQAKGKNSGYISNRYCQ